MVEKPVPVRRRPENPFQLAGPGEFDDGVLISHGHNDGVVIGVINDCIRMFTVHAIAGAEFKGQIRNARRVNKAICQRRQSIKKGSVG